MKYYCFDCKKEFEDEVKDGYILTRCPECSNMKDEYGREVYKSDKHCSCEMPAWTVEDMDHCAKCLKLLPDVKGEKC